MTFKDLNLHPRILDALAKENHITPTPIQEQAIPPVLEGRDLLGCAQTGTGKTAAFALPILQLLHNKPREKGEPRRIRSLILTPTRELAMQIYESIHAYGRFTKLNATVVFGGVSQAMQVKKLQRGVDILVATPGRLLDLYNQRHIDLTHVEIFVLDEADRMLDMGFIGDVKKIISKMPEKKQTLFFSATMPPEIVEMVNMLLVDPVEVKIEAPTATVEAIEQSICFVDKDNKRKLLTHLLEDPSIRSALVFSRTKHGADRIVKELEYAGIRAQAIHSDKSQKLRQHALNSFKKGDIRVLVATDIAARGIDIQELSCVFNLDLPDEAETYVHRIGRTGRAGMSGVAISFCCIDEMPNLKAIEKLIGFKISVMEDHPYPMLETTPTKKARPRSRRPYARSNERSSSPPWARAAVRSGSPKPKGSDRSDSANPRTAERSDAPKPRVSERSGSPKPKIAERSAPQKPRTTERPRSQKPRTANPSRQNAAKGAAAKPRRDRNSFHKG